MGCINAKQVGNVVAASHVSVVHHNSSHGLTFAAASFPQKQQPRSIEVARDDEKSSENGKTMDHHHVKRSSESRKSKRWSSSRRRSGSFSFNFGFSHRIVEAEQVAAGWPAWLCSAAGEAVHGWVPLQADAFEKLDKIGQDTYSSVFQAREVETGRMVALKKLQFDNSQPDSIRFMAREITILRRLDHPNIMKLEGVITSRFSSTVYLVFEYMEHDLAGLSSSPDINFSEPQVKCYMKQLLLGLEHCHSRGIMHRDIKASNILVNNEGTLKLGDFGLANILTSKNKHRLTSRVVTLWYRPPELLMGSTSYEASVDLWSVGCVFAELLIGKPILKGRTEANLYFGYAEIFRFSHDRYRHAYRNCLRERCKDIPPTALNLLEALLSVEPHKRGTASSSLISEYFYTKPHACDPSSLPKYLPSKEIDAKQREELRRKKSRSRIRDSGVSRRTRRSCNTSVEAINFGKTALKEEVRDDTQFATKSYGFTASSLRGRDGTAHRAPPPLTGSSSFSWAKKQKDSTSTLCYNRPSSLCQPSDAGASSFSVSNAKIFELKKQESQDVPGNVYTASEQQEQLQNRSNRHNKFDRSDHFYSSVFQAHDFSAEFHQEDVIAINNDMVGTDAASVILVNISVFFRLMNIFYS
ncbi:putative serine/threonine-protein kinase [Hibiscus syriacus]|uniref:Serine/threonine-protein kinase n=1 Tax=Hibiscus syriacus TaxID=106335 RepID=A0A6A2XXZ3_HIBSY|nr:putative serine/threonine-protein kinase [Hibiscus syriacus]